MNTSETQLIRVEVVGDLPVLWATLLEQDLPAIMDRHFPTALHWKGPVTPGEVLAVWLLFILSEGDHCLNHVEPWVGEHQGTLAALLGKPVLPTDLHDDRLADWLTRLGAPGAFAPVEIVLNQQAIRVYQLPTDLIRIDTTTANSYADVQSDQGLLQFGHSKDDPDRPQVKVALAILDPLGMPLATAVVPGNTADDPLYIPAIAAVRQSVGKGGRTYVGDCKMAALGTRSYVAEGEDYYLCPLAEAQLSRADRLALLQPVFDGSQELERVNRPGPEGEADELVAEGFSVDVELTDLVDGKRVNWTERRHLVRSEAYAVAQAAGLDRRLARAEAALLELPVRKRGKKQLFHKELVQAADDILGEHGVQGLLSYTIEMKMAKRQMRPYAGREGRLEVDVSFALEVQAQEEEIQRRKREMGWQVYATNGLLVSLVQVVWAYRGQYRVENDWSRMKSRPLGLTPMYMQNEQRIAGLIYLLSLALRSLTLVEWVARESLRKKGETLQGVYAGQAGRKTARPSAELLLRAFRAITVSVVVVAGQIHNFLSPLTKVQQRLLHLWNLPHDLYEKVALAFPSGPYIMSEP